MQLLQVSGTVRPIYGSLGVKRLKVVLYVVIFLLVLTVTGVTDVCIMENIWAIFSFLFICNYIISFVAAKVIIAADLVSLSADAI
jgi:hypothetical protein